MVKPKFNIKGNNVQQTTEVPQDVVVDQVAQDQIVTEPTLLAEETVAVEKVTKEPQAVEPTAVSSTNLNKQQTKGFTPVHKIELELISYNEAMKRGKAIVPQEGGKWQYSLFNTIKSVFSAKTQEEFNAEFNTILNFFNKNKDGIFNEKFIFRFPQHWPGSDNEYSLARRLIYLIIQTADPSKRKKALDSINLESVTNGLTEDQKQKLFSFYI